MKDYNPGKSALLALCGFSGWVTFLGLIAAISFGVVENILTASISAVVVLFSTLVMTSLLSRERNTE